MTLALTMKRLAHHHHQRLVYLGFHSCCKYLQKQLQQKCSENFIARGFSSSLAASVHQARVNHSNTQLWPLNNVIANFRYYRYYHRQSQNPEQLNYGLVMTKASCKTFCSEQTQINKMPSSTPTSEQDQKNETDHQKKPQNQAHGYQKIESKQVGPEPDVVVDLRSDTVTLPSKGMREAIANAVVGDDVFSEDPTTNEFETRIAALLQKEAALLVTSGTQGNLISALVHCNARGSEMICGDNAHMFKYEQGNISQFGGIHSCQIPNQPDGTFSLEELKHRFRSDDMHYPITKLVCVENTHNRCGGRILPLEWLDQLAEICKEQNIPIHMDGARVFNAAEGSGVPISRIVRDMSSVSICLSKGLGSPAGSVIVGTRAFIEQARRMRKALGGGIRQNGIIAAAGLYCLDNMISRLKEDHQNAKIIAEIVNSKGGKNVQIDTEKLQTNIMVLQVNGCSINEFIEKLAIIGPNENEERERCEGKTTLVKCFPWSENSARLVTHCDITSEMARNAALKICYVASKLSG